MSRHDLGEIGALGLKRFGGAVYEEFLTELQGKKGVEIYREMSENDDVIGAILYSMEMLLRQVSWQVVPASHQEKDQKAAEFIETCMDDMEETWTDFISEVLSFLTYGWSYHEIVYKRRMGKSKDPQQNSKFSDGLIGWRKLPIRSQDTLYEWHYNGSTDHFLGMMQSAPPTYAPTFIPVEKALHFRTKSRKGNPEGRSILRNAYRSWYFKNRIQELEGIGVERDLAGLPVLTAPENVNIWDEAERHNLQKAEEIVSSVRRDEREGLVLGGGWSFQLLSSGGNRQFDTCEIIQRYDNRMAMTVLADFIFLGHEQVGSFALSSDKTAIFAVALGSFLDMICEVFTGQAIVPLIDLNAKHFQGTTGYPTLEHSDIESQNLGELGTFLKDMVGIGAITPDASFEDFLRRTADLPDRDPDTEYAPPQYEE